MLVKTVLGTKNIPLTKAPAVLAHEHIAGFSYYLRMMSADYFDSEAIENRAVSILKNLKNRREKIAQKRCSGRFAVTLHLCIL